MFKFNRPLKLMVAALALAIGSALITTQTYAEVPEQASSQLEQIASAR